MSPNRTNYVSFRLMTLQASNNSSLILQRRCCGICNELILNCRNAMNSTSGVNVTSPKFNLASDVAMGFGQFISVFGLFSNSAFLLVILKSGHAKAHHSFILLSSFILSNFGNAFINASLYFPSLIAHFYIIPPRVFYSLSKFADLFFLSMLLHLFAITFERFLAVFLPNTYRIYLSRKLMIIISLFLWSTSILIILIVNFFDFCCLGHEILFDLYLVISANESGETNVYWTAISQLMNVDAICMLVIYPLILARIFWVTRMLQQTNESSVMQNIFSLLYIDSLLRRKYFTMKMLYFIE